MTQNACSNEIILDDKTIKAIKKLTAINDHGAAYLTAAQALKQDDLAERFASINKQHSTLGHLPFDLYDLRMTAYRELMSSAQRLLSTAQYKRFYASF